MTDLRKGIRDYLMLRRGLGFQLVKHEARLEEFASFLERKSSARITSELAVEWATLPVDCQPCYWTARLGFVRGFAQYWSAIDPLTEVPPGGLLPYRSVQRVRAPTRHVCTAPSSWRLRGLESAGAR
jgi:hypothetical protein